MRLFVRCVLGGIGAGILLFCVVLAVVLVRFGFSRSSGYDGSWSEAGVLYLLIAAVLYGLCGAVAGVVVGLVTLLVKRLRPRSSTPAAPATTADETVWPPPVTPPSIEKRTKIRSSSSLSRKRLAVKLPQLIK